MFNKNPVVYFQQVGNQPEYARIFMSQDMKNFSFSICA